MTKWENPVDVAVGVPVRVLVGSTVRDDKVGNPVRDKVGVPVRVLVGRTVRDEVGNPSWYITRHCSR